MKSPAAGVIPPLLTNESTRRLRSGNEMPVLGMGTWMLTSHTADAIADAVQLGYRMFDTAADYHTQSGIGAAIRALDYPRDALYIVTKVEPQEDGYEATRRNLEELDLEYADLVLIHEAPERGVGEACWNALLRARDEGFARDIGVCSYKVDQLRELAEKTGEMPAVHQLEWSPFGHSFDMLHFCAANGIQLQAYSPLTHGKRLEDERLVNLARKYQKTPAQLLIRWNLQHGVVPIPKSIRADHRRENLEVFDFDLEAVDVATLDALNERFSALEKLEYL
jgi:2,5-diketo-D-gluconate reductase A